jgi:ubiquinone biosynthesis protein COQ4
MQPTPQPKRKRIQPLRAVRAIRALIANPDETAKVFDIIDALSGNAGERLFQRFLATPTGERILRERRDLLATLDDRAYLESLPPGSLGRVYAEFTAREKITGQGLADASMPNRRDDIGPERRLFADRLRDMHDLWHVTTGYGRDLIGEAALLAFSYAQTRNRGIGAIVLAAAVLGPKRLDFFWPRYLWRAWRRGRRTRPLPMVAYEELLPLPLTEVRRRLRIEPPEVAHPGGVIVFEPQAQGASS